MKILVACEWSGVVRDSFRDAGHDAWSCDLEDVEPCGNWSNYHLYGDVLWFLKEAPGGGKWDMMIAFPPCTYLCSSGLHWNKKNPLRKQATENALRFVKSLLNADIPKIGLENPTGCIGTRIRPADQYVQPYDFREDASKKTGLWLKGLPKLQPTKRIQGRKVEHKGKIVERWSNQTDSGQNRLGPSEKRAAERGKTYQGIADAMVKQWGDS